MEDRKLPHIPGGQAGFTGSETNKRLTELLHGDTCWLDGLTKPAGAKPAVTVMGGITSQAEEVELLALNEWVDDRGLPRGVLSYDYTAPDTKSGPKVIQSRIYLQSTPTTRLRGGTGAG